MKENKYLIDFDTQVSDDNQTLRLLRNNKVFEVKKGDEAHEFILKLIKINELLFAGFSYCFLEFDGILDEWYEKTLVDSSKKFEGITLMYYPETDSFEVPELQMKFTEMEKAEKMIKAFIYEKF